MTYWLIGLGESIFFGVGEGRTIRTYNRQTESFAVWGIVEMMCANWLAFYTYVHRLAMGNWA